MSFRGGTLAGRIVAMVAICVLGAASPALAQGGEETLLRLAERALAEGDLTTARSRYQRVLAANAGSDRAMAGLGDVAARLGDAAESERYYRAALEIQPGLSSAQLGLADLLHARGDAAAARMHLDAALVTSPLDPQLHQRLWAWTGLARDVSDTGAAAVRERARAHPYDPRAQVALAQLAIVEGDEKAARGALETALLMADVVPQTAATAAGLLASLDAKPNRFVQVHLYADETVRAVPEWKFELRIAWGRASAALRPLLATTFVPVSIQGFPSAGVGDELGAIHGAMVASLERQPLSGILAGFTRRKSPRTRTANRLGEASYLGRELVVRLDPSDVEGRTLAHEVLHLYGAMHLAPEIPSLMNPTGGQWILDPYNARIVRVTGRRRFGPGSLERNVLARVDGNALADALVAALQVNVRYRNEDVAGALAEAEKSKGVARYEARKATMEDEPLAQVAEVTAGILMRMNRPVAGVQMMDNAARLHGPHTKRGRAAQAQADAWREIYQSLLPN